MADETTKPTCFVVCPIGAEGSPARKHSDYVLKFILEPVLAERFHVVRADHIATPGMVTSQVIRHLVNAELVVADLTGHNPNVMYELAVRHALKKPFVQLIAKEQKLPFDVGEQRTIFFELTDLQSVEDCKRNLAAQATAAMASGFVPETPLSRLVAIDAFVSGKPENEVLSQILSKLDTLTTEVASLRSTATSNSTGRKRGLLNIIRDMAASTAAGENTALYDGSLNEPLVQENDVFGAFPPLPSFGGEDLLASKPRG